MDSDESRASASSQQTEIDWSRERQTYQSLDYGSAPLTGNSSINHNMPEVTPNLHANLIQPGSIVFSLLSSSEPTLQQVSRFEAAFSIPEENRVEAAFSRLEENRVEVAFSRLED